MLLGYVGDRVSEKVASDDMVSFLGGKRAVTHVVDASTRPPQCTVCRVDMNLVVQLHAPIQGYERRFLVIYACGACRQEEPGRWCCLRQQVPNEAEPACECGDAATPVKAVARPQMAFGSDSPSARAALFAVPDWGDDLADAAQSGFGFATVVDVLDVEEAPPGQQQLQASAIGGEARWLDFGEDTCPVVRVKKRYEKMAQQIDGQWSGEKHEPEDPKEKAFRRMKDALSRHPQQVLRYHLDGKPLWVSPPDFQVPRCSCGGTRSFEMQLMGSLVYLCEEYQLLDGKLPEFGVACVYTCTSCQPTGNEKKEFIAVQNSL